MDNPLLTTYIAFLNTYFSSLNMNLTDVTTDLGNAKRDLKVILSFSRFVLSLSPKKETLPLTNH